MDYEIDEKNKILTLKTKTTKETSTFSDMHNKLTYVSEDTNYRLKLLSFQKKSANELELKFKIIGG